MFSLLGRAKKLQNKAHVFFSFNSPETHFNLYIRPQKAVLTCGTYSKKSILSKSINAYACASKRDMLELLTLRYVESECRSQIEKTKTN